MKKLNKGKVLAFKGVLALIVATLMTTLVFIGCKQNAGDEGVSTAKKYKVTLEQTANGNVTVSPTLPTDGMVEENAVLTFTATAAQGFKVDNWEITGVTPQEGGTAGSLTAKIKVTQNVTVKANFIAKAKYKVTLEQTANGNVTVSPTLPSDGMVEEDTVFTFTATADQGFKVGNWEITGVTPQEGGTAGSLTAKIKVTQNVTVKANFTAKAKYRVTVGVLGVERYGTLTTDASNLDQVEEDTIVIFTANPDSEYRSVEKWQVAGADIVNNDENGKVKKTYEHKITGDLDVKVQFEKYAKVPNDKLKEYLESNKTYEDIPNYIEIIGVIPLTDFKGSGESECGELGKKIKDNISKKVGLRINYPEGLKDMSSCFIGCKNIISLESLPSTGLENISYCFKLCDEITTFPSIPKGVKNMQGCFYMCKKLTKAPTIPSSVTNLSYCFSSCSMLTDVTLECAYNSQNYAFVKAFGECQSLANDSIKVPTNYYNDYVTDGALTAMAVPGNSHEERKAKFKAQ